MIVEILAGTIVKIYSILSSIAHGEIYKYLSSLENIHPSDTIS